MTPLDLLRSIAGSDRSLAAHHHPALELEDLEPRQLLSAVQGTTSADSNNPQVIGATAGAPLSLEVGTQVPGGYSVVTHAVGDINYLQSELPLNDLLANASELTANVYSTQTGVTAALGLTSLPITPLLTPMVTENETPLENGTPDLGTVWITLPPLPTGLFHMETTEIPLTSNSWMQAPNPQGGPPTFTHFGQAANGSLNGASVNQPVAVGPIGPSITEEVEPVQPPSVEAHQPAGPPTMIQQDETTPQQNAQTPPGGEQGAGQPGTPGQGAAPGQSAGAEQGHARSAGGETTQGVQASTPHSPGRPSARSGGNQVQTGEASGGTGGAPTGGGQGRSSSGGSSGGSGAFLLHPADPNSEPPADLIDEAIPVLVANSLTHTDDPEDAAGAVPTAFGAAAVAVGGFHLALRGDRTGRANSGGRKPRNSSSD